jgi:hypothetical protein
MPLEHAGVVDVWRDQSRARWCAGDMADRLPKLADASQAEAPIPAWTFHSAALIVVDDCVFSK